MTDIRKCADLSVICDLLERGNSMTAMINIVNF
jgi:hypothetical protein